MTHPLPRKDTIQRKKNMIPKKCGMRGLAGGNWEIKKTQPSACVARRNLRMCTQPPTVVRENGSSVGIRTHCMHVSALLASICSAHYTTISASELSREVVFFFIRSASLVGCTWLQCGSMTAMTSSGMPSVIFIPDG